MHARNYFKNKILWKRIIQKVLTHSTLFFLPNPVPFEWQSCQKRKGPGTSDQLLFRLRNKFRKFFFSYTLSDQVWWFNIKWFLSYSKNSWHHKLFHFHLSFCIYKVWKGREKIAKLWISWEWKEFFRWNKKHFS